MFRIIQGTSVLLLLSAFFAYVLAPIVDSARRRARFGPRRRARFGPRRRPVPRAAVIVLLYIVIFAAVFAVWRSSAGRIRETVHVSAPAAIDRLFKGGDAEPSDILLARLPTGFPFRNAAAGGVARGVGYIESEVRATFGDLLAASHYARWLAVVPLVAFFLVTAAPGFRRSAERLLPHGHLQWRVGEYLRDVNSAMAGYVRAQLAAGVIVGTICVVGFALLGLPNAMAMGIIAGVLELIPAIGPIATFLMAISQAEQNPIAVAAFLGGLRVVQDYVIYPRLVRRGMHLATPVVVIAIWCGAALAGATGVILAIPIAGLLSVSLRHWKEYRAIERTVSAHARRQAGGP